MKHYSIADISRETKIPESTLRYYRDKYAEYLTAHGKGRNRRYDKDSILVFTTIKELFEEGLSAEQVEARLDEQFSRVIEVDNEGQQERSNEIAPYTKGIAPFINSFIDSHNRMTEAFEQQTELILEQNKTLKELRDEMTALKENEDLKQKLQDAEEKQQELVKQREEITEELHRPLRFVERLLGRRKPQQPQQQLDSSENSKKKSKEKAHA